MPSSWFYIIAPIALAVGSWLFLQSLDPVSKRRWLPRVAYFNMIAMGLLIFGVTWLGNWDSILAVAILVGPVLAFFLYCQRQVRVCTSCGQIVQPQNLIKAADYCFKCGAPLSN